MKRIASLVASVLVIAGSVWAQNPSIEALQAEVTKLRQRVAELEGLKDQLANLEQQLKELQQQAPSVTAANKEVKISLDGRLFAGVFSTRNDGSFPNRSLDIPDGKLRFVFSPTKYVTIVNRFNTSRADTNPGKGFDYFYVDLKDWLGAAPGHTIRIGKHKLDVGQETWTDNPIESILITNAVSHVSGYDEGINLRGPLTRSERPLTYSLELVNGSQGVVISDEDLAWGAKIGLPVTDQLYVSASYFRTGNLVKRDGTLDKPDFNIAEVFDPPAGATGWRRNLWEIDIRYGYGKEGIKSAVGSEADVPWQFAAAYGRFTDDAQSAADRKGNFGLVEALCNLTPKVYLATRYSQVSLENGIVAKLGGCPVAVNEYRRFSFGLGYRLSRLTHFKVEYTRNDTNGGTSKPKIDQFALGVATKF